MNGITIKKTKKTALEEARQIAKQVAKEPGEFLVHTKSQAMSSEAHPEPVQQIATSDTKVSGLTSQDVEEINTRSRKRLDELKQELAKLSHERETKGQEWKQEQEKLLGTAHAPQSENTQPLVQPTTKPKRGFPGLIKQKQGTKEMGKGLSG